MEIHVDLFRFYMHGKENNRSILNEDVYQNHLRSDPMCEYGIEIENAEHYFFKCSLFSDIGSSLFIL